MLRIKGRSYFKYIKVYICEKLTIIVSFMLEKNQKEENLMITDEKDNSLVDFFDLLLKVDRRNNPHLYKLEEDNKNND